MLTRSQKEAQVEDLRERLGRATSVFVADYCGLTVQQAEELRASIYKDAENPSEYQVVKNSMLRLATNDSELDCLREHFSGPTALALAYGDPVSLAKTLVAFGKEYDAFEIKGAYLDGQSLDSAGVAQLATLPNLFELRGMLAGLVQAPALKLVRLLFEPAGQIARLLEARRGSLEEAEGS
ncbi:MAG: 50S ribosomal protein L10 [Myxococcota bacterium]